MHGRTARSHEEADDELLLLQEDAQQPKDGKGVVERRDPEERVQRRGEADRIACRAGRAAQPAMSTLRALAQRSLM